MDPLLEHFMPSLMALKKAQLGDNPEALESHLFLLSAFIKFKNKKIRGEPKTFSKTKPERTKTSIVKVGASLELCSCSRKLCES